MINFLLFILALILAIYTLSKLKSLDKRLRNLEKHKINTEHLDTTSSASVERPAPPFDVPSSSSKEESSNIPLFFQWFARDWPLKTGAFFILLGFVWLATYAFLNNWIGPVGRISFGLIVGTLILYGGELRLKKIRNQGITLVWLGAAVMTVSVYAAQFIYNMLPPFVALSFIFLIMILTTTISLMHKSLSLSLASLLIGGLAPILIHSKELSILELHLYLFVIVGGVIWVVRQSGWRILTFLSIVIIALYNYQYFFDITSLTPLEILQLQTSAAYFTSLFYFISLLPLLRNKRVESADLFVAGAVGLFALGWIHGIIDTEYRGIISMLIAVAFAIASYLIFIKTGIKSAVYLYTAVGIMLLGTGTSYQFTGPALVIAFALQAMLLPIVGAHLLEANIGKYILLYFILPIFLSLEYISSPLWSQGIWQDAFIALFVITGALFITGLYFYYSKTEPLWQFHNPSLIIIIIASLYGLLLIWKSFHALLAEEYIARMIIIFVYSMVGLIAYLTGEVQKRIVLNRFGLGILIFVIARLLFIEVWDMALAWRIVTFFAIGVLFILSVLLRKTRTI